LFELGHRDNVLVAPNTALRYIPQSEQVAPEFREVLAAVVARRGDSGGGDAASGWPRPALRPTSQKAPDDGTLWVRKGEFLVPVTVQVGLTDGWVTQVDGPELREGLEVVIGEQHSGENGGTKNPLLSR
jgi:hypothetical protein